LVRYLEDEAFYQYHTNNHTYTQFRKRYSVIKLFLQLFAKGNVSMTSTEAMIYQLKKLKGKPLKQKLEYILTYFWLPIVLFLALTIAVGSYICHRVTMKDMALSVICINAYADSEDAKTIALDFAKEAEIDMNEYDVDISTDLILDGENLSVDYYTAQKIAGQISAASVDLLVSDLNTAIGYFYQDIFWDLNQLLTPSEKTQYAENFLFVDMALVRQLLEDEVQSVQFPDPTKPEEMEEPVPVALLLNGNSAFTVQCFPHNTKSVAVGIVFNSKNLENALAFMDFIMQ